MSIPVTAALTGFCGLHLARMGGALLTCLTQPRHGAVQQPAGLQRTRWRRRCGQQRGEFFVAAGEHARIMRRAGAQWQGVAQALRRALHKARPLTALLTFTLTYPAAFDINGMPPLAACRT